jgi:hypothetical protein
MLRRFDRRLAALAGLVVLGGLSVPAAWASHHLMMVREVYAGNATGSADEAAAQFVELQMYAVGQNLVSGHKVVVYSASGAPVATFTFGGNVAKGDSQSSILVATAQAQTVFGVTADLTMGSAAIPAAGGKVCFESSSLGVIDCVAWGSYGGSSAGVGAPFNATEGLAGGASIQRTDARGTVGTLDTADDSNDSAADFAFAEPRPRNNAGNTGQACCSVGFSASLYSVNESAGSATVNVTRSGSGLPAMTVQYSTADGTATQPADYTASSGTLSFSVNQASASFSVPIASDGFDEANETVNLKLRNPSVGVLSRANATLQINGTLSPPGAPQSLTAAAGPGNGQITLNWSAPATGTPTGYRVYRGSSPGTETLLTSLGNVLTFTDSGLGGGATRYYQVSALNAAGEGPRSNEASATTFAELPGAPGLSAVAGPGKGQISLTWSAAAPNGSPIVEYRIYAGATPGDEAPSPIAVVGPTVSSYADSGLADNVQRSYKVSAVNGVGEGPRSNEATARTFQKPSPPLNLHAQLGILQTLLTWQPPANNGGTITGYRIYRGTSSAGEVLLAEVGNVTAFSDTTCRLTVERICFYVVRAFNPADQSDPSNEVSLIATRP